MSLENIVSVTITAATAAPTRIGFGTPLLLAFHAIGAPARVLTYKKPSEMTTAGFASTHPAKRAADVLCSQDNKPEKFKIGRMASGLQQTVTLKCTSAVAGDVYKIDVTTQGVSVAAISRTVPGSSSVNAEATALAALLDALPQITATASTDTVTVVTTSTSEITIFENWSNNLQFHETTANLGGGGIAAELDAIQAEDPDWYVLLCDAASCSEIVINAMSAWAAANGKLFLATSSDYGIGVGATTTDVASDNKGLGYDHTAIVYNGKKSPGLSASGLAGDRLAFLPGDATWSFKTLTGVTAEVPLTSQITAFQTKNVVWYELIQGINQTQNSKVSSGEWIDVVWGLDWLKAEIKLRVFTLFANAKKIPYTDAGVDLVKGAVMGALLTAVNRGILAASPAPVVTAPLVKDVSSADKAGRRLPDVNFTGTLAGAIESTTVAGTVSV